MKKASLIFALLAAFTLASGCGNKMWDDTKDTAENSFNYVFDTAPTAESYHDLESIPLIQINHRAADKLFHNIQKKEITGNSNIYFKEFTNARTPSDDSIFGLVITQHVGERMVQQGVRLTKGDPKATDYFPPQNVDIKKYDDPVKYIPGDLPPRAGLLEGHYVVSDHYIYVTATITRLDDNVIISGHNWTVPLSDNVRNLLDMPKPDGGLTPVVNTQFGVR